VAPQVDEDELVSIVDGLRAAIEATLPSLGA